MNFSKEPIIWLGAIGALAMTGTDILNGNFGLETLDAALVAIGAVIGRNLVVPVAKYRDELNKFLNNPHV